MSNTSTTLSLRDIKPETALAIRESGRDYLVSARDIVEWVAPGAPIGEAKKFLLVCQTAGLNPLLGDIDLLNLGGKWQSVVRKNGYLKCARRDPDYDGHESGVTIQAFEKTPKGLIIKKGPFHDIPGTIIPDGHLLIGGWCKLYRKNISRPFFKRVSFAEYNKGGDVNGPWRKIPATMIEKVAIAHACRESIDLLAATYDESELPLPPSVETRVAVADMPVAPQGERRALPPSFEPFPRSPAPFSAPEIVAVDAQQAELASPEQIASVKSLMARVGMSPQGMSESLDRRGVTRFEDLDQLQIADMISKLEFKLDRAEFDPFPATPAPAVEAELIDAPATPETAVAPDNSEVIDAELS